MKKIKLGSENLTFQKIINKSIQNTLVYGLFRDDGTLLGESFCSSHRYNGKVWSLDDIYIVHEFKRRGYGSQLLEMTCKSLWDIQKMDIVLERPGDTIADDGFSRQEWYERHGFESSPAPLTWMTRPFPSLVV